MCHSNRAFFNSTTRRAFKWFIYRTLWFFPPNHLGLIDKSRLSGTPQPLVKKESRVISAAPPSAFVQRLRGWRITPEAAPTPLCYWTSRGQRASDVTKLFHALRRFFSNRPGLWNSMLKNFSVTGELLFHFSASVLMFLNDSWVWLVLNPLVHRAKWC